MYPSLGEALNETGRPILYSCSWPAYQVDEGTHPDYQSISKHCNLWRNFNDIDDSWQSVLSIIDFYAQNQDDFERYHGPGHWFDPDMVIVGDFGLSLDESRAQFSIWSILAAPLLLSSDLRTLTPEQRQILLNRHVIAVNQDPRGELGKRVITSENKKIEVWAKKLSGDGYAIAYLHRGGIGNPRYVSHPHSSCPTLSSRCTPLIPRLNAVIERQRNHFLTLHPLTCRHSLITNYFVLLSFPNPLSPDGGNRFLTQSNRSSNPCTRDTRTRRSVACNWQTRTTSLICGTMAKSSPNCPLLISW